MYVSLYGTCCTKNEGLLKTTNGMFRDNYINIKEHVLSFVDNKGNCILHILIASKFSDWFAAIAFSPKLHYKDVKNSTIYHHCLRSSNDDETCDEYLEILLNEPGGLKSLNYDDVNRDTALSIATKDRKRSRILNILRVVETLQKH